MELSNRQTQMLDILKRKKTVSFSYFCETLSYSLSTVRRDLLQLEDMGLIKRYKGGASILITGNKVTHYKLRELERVGEKEAIARLAQNFLSDGMTVFIDSSTTAAWVCPLLTEHKEITVITNGLEVAHYLLDYPQVEVFVAGGYLREYSSAIVGEHAAEFINQFQADLTILSCFGIDEEGLYEPSLQQAYVKQQMLRNSKLAILLCDSSKFGMQYKFKLCGFEQVSALLTDRMPSPELARAITDSGCEILV